MWKPTGPYDAIAFEFRARAASALRQTLRQHHARR